MNVKSPLYQIKIRGDSSQPVMIDVMVPNDAEPWEALDLYTWTGDEWKWVGRPGPNKLGEGDGLDGPGRLGTDVGAGGDGRGGRDPRGHF